MSGEHIRGIPRTYEKEITLADTPYTLSVGFNCVKVDTTGGNVRVNLPNVNYPIDVIKTSSDSYIVTVWVSGVQIGEVCGELSKITIENAEVTKDEPWYPYDAIVGIAGVSGDGGEVLAKDRFGRVIAGGRGVAGTDDGRVIQAAYDVASILYIGPGNYYVDSCIHASPERGCLALRSNTEVFGSFGSTKIYNSNAGDEYTFAHYHPTNGISNIYIHDLSFGFDTYGYGAIWFDHVTDSLVERVICESTQNHVPGWPDEYIFLNWSDNNIFRDITLVNSGHISILLNSSDKNLFDGINIYDYSVAVWLDSAETDTPCFGNVFTNINIEDTNDGFWFSNGCFQNVVNNSRIFGTTRNAIGISTDAHDNLFHGVVIDDCGDLSGDIKSISVSNTAGIENNFYKIRVFNSPYTAMLVGNAYGTIQDSVFYNSGQLGGNPSWFLSLGISGSKWRILNNKFLDDQTIHTQNYCIYLTEGAFDCDIKNNYFENWRYQCVSPTSRNNIQQNRGFIAPGESRSASGRLTAGNANAIAFAWHNPELQDILIKKVTIRITTPGGTAGSLLDVGIADDATGTNLGTEFFNDLDLNTAGISDQDITPVFCQDSVSATDGWVVGKILVQNAASLVGSYYIEYIGA
jgi:hypothetical protein